MKDRRAVVFSAQPATDASDILWTISVGSAHREEKLLIELKDYADAQFWVITIRARNFEAVEVMREKARRCLEALSN